MTWPRYLFSLFTRTDSAAVPFQVLLSPLPDFVKNLRHPTLVLLWSSLPFVRLVWTALQQTFFKLFIHLSPRKVLFPLGSGSSSGSPSCGLIK